MARRRSSSDLRSRATDGEPSRKSAEAAVAHRLTDLEETVRQLQTLCEAQVKRTAAVQAQLDHVIAKLRHGI
jgi:hypothetical protein